MLTSSEVHALNICQWNLSTIKDCDVYDIEVHSNGVNIALWFNIAIKLE